MSAKRNVEAIWHRGASAYEPENTLRSFERAIQMGADAIELDVHLTKDGEVVVIHDGTLDRTTNGKGDVAKHTLGALRRLDAGGGERIPTLEDVINIVPGRAIIMVELKEKVAAAPTCCQTPSARTSLLCAEFFSAAALSSTSIA